MAMMTALESAAAARGEPPLRLRVGVATGEVVAKIRTVGRHSDLAVTGETVTTAMRLQELAEPGEILLDDATVRAARKRIEAEIVGEHMVRGRSAAVRVHRLRGERLHRLVGAAGPGLLIGRVGDRSRRHLFVLASESGFARLRSRRNGAAENRDVALFFTVSRSMIMP